ncbi:MAG: CRISPR-associated endonuclease Cas1, partial [Chloroflexota bacterium]
LSFECMADGEKFMSLIRQIASQENMMAAWKRVAENRGGAGVDGVTCDLFAVNVYAHLAELANEVLSGTYAPSPLLSLVVFKNNGEGERRLAIPTVRDRIAQSAVLEIIGPMLDETFSDCSYAYRKGKSIQQAVMHVRSLLENGFPWVVDADIQGFFDEVDHAILAPLLDRHVHDERVSALMMQWVSAPAISDAGRMQRSRGIPQGSPISPLLANLYLDFFDKALLQGGLNLVRYSDDFVILCRSLSEAEEALRLANQKLLQIQLRLNPEKTGICAWTEGFWFLGERFQEDRLRDIPGEIREDAVAASPSKEIFPISPFPPQEDAVDSVDYDSHRRTLYVLEQGTTLGIQAGRMEIRKEKSILMALPANWVSQIYLFGNVTITPFLLRYCLYQNVELVYLSARGNYHGRLGAQVSPAVGVIRRQLAFKEEPRNIQGWAQSIVGAKLRNSLALFRKRYRKGENDAIDQCCSQLISLREKLELSQTLEEARGYEGRGAAVYFEVWKNLTPPEFGFTHRNKQPPKDPINSMLSFGYTLLFQNIYSMIVAAGLHPGIGYLHDGEDRFPALVSDLMEEFRAPVVDTLVLGAINRKQFTPADFSVDSSEGGCLFSPAARKRFLDIMEKRMRSTVSHPDSQTPVSWRRCMEFQTARAKRFILGNENEYKPLLWSAQ